jgi:hypothetical protein
MSRLSRRIWEVTPVAELLMRGVIPILFHCGRLPLHLRYPGVPVYFKPILLPTS